MAALLLALILPFSNAQAASLNDGTYSVNYTVMKAEGTAVSMANDYWLETGKSDREKWQANGSNDH